MKMIDRNNGTVNKLCNVLREQMKIRKIEKISVSELAILANVHRITFYYYFQDKYDLLHYLFEEDINNIVMKEKCEDVLSRVKVMFKYLDNNQSLYNNAFASDDYLSLRRVYLSKTKEYLSEVINDLSGTKEFMVDKDYLIEFYSNATIEFMINWLKKEDREAYDVIADQMIKIIEYGFMRCIGNNYSK